MRTSEHRHVDTDLREALGQLSKTHHEYFMSAALRAGCSWNDAEEVVQEGLCKAVRNIDSLHDSQHMQAWVWRIIYNAGINSHRRKPVLFMDTDLKGSTPEDYIADARAEEPLDTLVRSEQMGVVLDQLDLLQANERAVMRDFYLRDLSIQEIKSQRNIPEGSVKRLLHQGRNKLRATVMPSNNPQ